MQSAKYLRWPMHQRTTAAGWRCLKIVNDQGLGAIMAGPQAQIDRRKGGAFEAYQESQSP